jgi:hypothetical protein
LASPPFAVCAVAKRHSCAAAVQESLRLAMLALAIAAPVHLASAAATAPIATRDTSLFSESGAASNGAGESIFVGRNGQGALRRGLLYFDVAAVVPAGALIQSVELRMRVNQASSANPFVVSLHRATADWGEAGSAATGGSGAPAQAGDATWTSRFFDASAWANAGGDFETASSSASIAGTGHYAWGSTAALVADVQAWLDSPTSNFGWFLVGDERTNNSAKRFDSSEATATGALFPTLAVTYAPVPEPGTGLLLCAGLAALGIAARRSR